MVTVRKIYELVRNDIIECHIDDDLLEVAPASILNASESSLCYFSPKATWSGGFVTPAFDKPLGLLITSSRSAEIFPGAKNWIIAENPRSLFAEICSALFSRRNGLPETAHGNGPGVHIEDSGIYINSEVQFEEGFYGSGVKIQPGVKIGKGTFIRFGSVLGSDGFGFERKTTTSPPTRLQHFGGLLVGENCEIGSNVTIDRGTFEDTNIGNNVKIDNNVHIAHNVIIGDGTMIVAGSVISGSAHIGAGVWVGPNATIKNKVRVGDGAHVGLGSVVLKDVANGHKVFGNPARSIS